MPKGTPRFKEVEDELKLLEHYAPLYETLEGRKNADDDLAWFGRKMAAWQTTTVYPVAMQLGSEDVDQSTRRAMTRLLYSYIVRRALCGLTTKNLNNVFQNLATKFRQDGASVGSFRAFFLGKDGASIRFPDERELRQKILVNNAYDLSPQPRLVDILWELEVASRSKFAEKHERPSGLWVEHVLPQTWTEDWPFSGSDYSPPFSDSPQSIARTQALNTLGNLTLMTGGLNVSSGNKSFEEKKKKLSEHTSLFLNKWFVACDDWDEESIRTRN